jgi:putative effector of murein hydrolase
MKIQVMPIQVPRGTPRRAEPGRSGHGVGESRNLRRRYVQPTIATDPMNVNGILNAMVIR